MTGQVSRYTKNRQTELTLNFFAGSKETKEQERLHTGTLDDIRIIRTYTYGNAGGRYGDIAERLPQLEWLKMKQLNRVVQRISKGFYQEENVEQANGPQMNAISRQTRMRIYSQHRLTPLTKKELVWSECARARRESRPAD